MDVINIGLVGYKFMGKAHSNAYRQVKMFFDPQAEVSMKAICGRDEDWVKQSAEKFGWESYETSWEKLIERDDINLIDITTPSNAHKQIAIEAANAGKNIFCEKPLAMNLSDSREMLECAEKNKVKHQIGFNYRFAPAMRLAKNLIDQGKLGKIYHVRAKYLQDFIIDPSFPLIWRLDKQIAGSGSHGDLGAHIIDAARYLAGDFARVTGMNKTFINKRPLVEKMEGLSGKMSESADVGEVTVDDATMFVCEFECGAMGTFEATRFAAGHKNDMSIEVNGSKGSLIFVFERMNELQYFNAEDPEGVQGFRLIQASEAVHPYMSAWWPVGHVIGYEHTFVHEMYEFLKSISNDAPTSPSFADGVACAQVLEAVDLSISRKQWVEVSSL